MSRVAKNPIVLPKGIELKWGQGILEAKGPKGSIVQHIPPFVEIKEEGGSLFFTPRQDTQRDNMMAGSARSLVNNVIFGIVHGFEKKLTLIGVGYRAQIQGQNLNLTLGFSHPVNFLIPQDIQIECPSQTEIVIKGADKQLVGQIAANIRAYRPPEPYKGKGIRYSDEVVIQKETKKKK